MSEDIIDLVLESFAGQHFVGIVDHKHLDVVGPQHLTSYQVEHSSGCA
jgi:hypothetical protein